MASHLARRDWDLQHRRYDLSTVVLGAPVPSLGFDTVVGVLLSPLAAGIALVDRLPSGLVLFVLGAGSVISSLGRDTIGRAPPHGATPSLRWFSF